MTGERDPDERSGEWPDEVREALRRSDELYRSLTAISHDAVFVQVPGGRIIAWSEAATRIFGIDESAALSGPAGLAAALAHLVREDGSAFATGDLPSRRTLSSGEPCRDVTIGFSRGEEQRWVSVSTSPLFAEGETRPYAVVVAAADVTERRRAEQALATSEELLRDLYETMAQGVVFQAADGRIISANPAAQRILGLTLDQLQGRTSSDPRWRAMRADGSDFPGEEHPAMVALRTGRRVEAVRMGIYHPEADATRWVLIDAVPRFRAGELHPHQVFTVFTDITDLRTAEAALQESEDRFRYAFDHSAVGMGVSDLDGHYTRLNDAFCRMMGYSREELEGQHFAMLAFPEDAACLGESVGQLMDGTASDVRLRRRMRAKDGTTRWADAVYALRRDAEGEPLHFITSMIDVTAQVHAQEQVERRTAQLEAANRELEAFVYSAAHDLRAPLRAIDGFGAILAEDYGGVLDDTGLGHLERIRAGAQRMGLLIDHLMALSRASRQELLLEEVDVSALAAEVCEEVSGAHRGRAIDFVVAPALSVRTDATVLRVILDNLVGNACKFTAGHATARIEIGAAVVDGETAFFVRDDGAGFDGAVATHLFGAFQRYHDPEVFPGDGIGLATVQRLVARLGGRVWAEAEVEKGAAFFFTLGTPDA